MNGGRDDPLRYVCTPSVSISYIPGGSLIAGPLIFLKQKTVEYKLIDPICFFLKNAKRGALIGTPLISLR